MSEIKISIIVPIYNVEKYLNRCVESLVNQTYKNIEIILVDDGSPDNCPKICDEWAKKDERIKVVHKKNEGVSKARNCGIDLAKGEYILFCDSDDFFDLKTCELLMNEFENKDLDLVIFSLNYINGKYITKPSINLEEIEYNRDFIINELIPNYINLTKNDKYQIQPYSVNKVYKTSILKKFDVKFDEKRRSWEDKPFVVSYLSYCKSFKYINGNFYNYVSNENSLSRNFNANILTCIIDNFNYYRNMFHFKFNFNDRYINDYYLNVMLESIFKLDLKNENNKKIVNNIIKNEIFESWIINSSLNGLIKFIFMKSKEKNKCLLIIHLKKYKNLKEIFAFYLKYARNLLERVMNNVKS